LNWQLITGHCRAERGPLPTRFATAAATAVPTTTASTATAAAEVPAARLRTSFVHDQRTTVHLVLMKLIDGLLSVIV
jgi:hypothetical protein